LGEELGKGCPLNEKNKEEMWRTESRVDYTDV
jgi:hypothetical protein